MFRAALVLHLIALSGAAACMSKKPETEAPQQTAARPFIVHDDVVELDYGQFLLAGGVAGLAPDRFVGLLEKALDGPGIASATVVLVAHSPHQNNFAMPLRIEVWRQQPPDDLAAWQQVLEAALDVDDAGQLWFESPTMRQRRWPVPTGRYVARIAGRGFVNHGWPGSTKPGDVWRVQLWPRTADIEPRRLREWKLPPARD